MSRPANRPKPTDDGMADKIAIGLIEGKGIKLVCAPEDMPSASAVYVEMARNADFREIIARAREAQQEAQIDQTIEMADEATAEDWQVVKMRIWARQWRASKLAPKKYGDLTKHEVSGPGGGPLVQRVERVIVDPVKDAHSD